MMRLGLVVWLLFLCTLQVYTRNPGFKARITKKGLQYVNDVALQALKANVQKQKLPNLSGKKWGIKFDITNINIQGFTLPSLSSLDTIPGAGLAWRGSNANIKVHGDFKYKKWFISGHGSFDATMAGVSFSLAVDIGKDENGKPSIAGRGCSSNIGHIDLKFHGRLRRLYNLVSGIIAGLIKETLNKQLCKLIYKEINEEGKKKLAKIPVTKRLAEKFLLDYRLTQKPSFQTQYMETYHKGEIFWFSDPTTESPLIPPPMPTNTDTDSMLYLWVSDYMFDTIGYTAHKHGFLVFSLTKKNLPPSNRGVLNTTCEGFLPKCIGKLIPQIGEKFPNSFVEMHMKSTQAPKMEVSNAGVSLNFAGKIELFATKPGTTSKPFLLSLSALMFTSVNVSIQNELLYASINDLKLKLKVGKSVVGKVDDEFLDFLIKYALDVYFIPLLNDIGQKGFPLPVTDEIKFQNTKVSFAKNTILISTDLSYSPSAAQDPIDDQSGPLRFRPFNRARA